MSAIMSAVANLEVGELPSSLERVAVAPSHMNPAWPAVSTGANNWHW